MGQIDPKEYELKTGERLTVRTAVPDDAILMARFVED